MTAVPAEAARSGAGDALVAGTPARLGDHRAFRADVTAGRRMRGGYTDAHTVQ